jgi:hypothetical protein
MKETILSFLMILVWEGVIILALALLPKCGDRGKAAIDNCTKAPWLDFLLSLILWIPWFVGFSIAGGWGAISAILAQTVVLRLWCWLHELSHPETVGQPRIMNFISRKLGWWRNQIALMVTALVIPVFFTIRFAELVCYPFLVTIVGFPNYQHSDWVNISRHKFQGLVGEDLVWCLYCDWMTGVYALGAEMLRNVESFWCPIRFDSSKKCQNCQQDFPDLVNGWVAADGKMHDVESILEKMYGEDKRSWFGHRDRSSL